jgi:hypothetical protein
MLANFNLVEKIEPFNTLSNRENIKDCKGIASYEFVVDDKSYYNVNFPLYGDIMSIPKEYLDLIEEVDNSQNI